MSLFSDRRLQIRLVVLMLGIAIIGLVPGWIDNPCLFARRDPNVAGGYGMNYDVRQPYIYSLCLYWFPQGEAQHDLVRRHRDEILALCRDRVAYHERMRD